MTKLTAKTKDDSYSRCDFDHKGKQKPSDLPGLTWLATLFIISLDYRERGALGNASWQWVLALCDHVSSFPTSIRPSLPTLTSLWGF